ncbi:MAG: hypothetical protein Q7U68_07125, partial [Candidatus Roizmanbacteria bacterium]|nr:hypothetical protein [Candidatus Roizmanbacteria bacterium]
MNLNEAKAQMITGEEYKFVGTLVPPMFAIARVGNLPLLLTHINMGKQRDLVVYDPNLKTEPPYRVVKPKN